MESRRVGLLALSKRIGKREMGKEEREKGKRKKRRERVLFKKYRISLFK